MTAWFGDGADPVYRATACDVDFFPEPQKGTEEPMEQPNQNAVASAYVETDSQRATRQNNFTYHAPRGDQALRYGGIRSLAGRFAEHLNQLCPPSRELSLAMTHLEQAVFWANAAIARNERSAFAESPAAQGVQPQDRMADPAGD